ncbi:MAG TPA: hypothetical protein PK850_04820 [Ignavibacteria bacterium]|nr:hypothetical protein [Ignavibacteria bacterium]HRF65258.1 hypothetical protein [Ignavibacteria bacterium]
MEQNTISKLLQVQEPITPDKIRLIELSLRDKQINLDLQKLYFAEMKMNNDVKMHNSKMKYKWTMAILTFVVTIYINSILFNHDISPIQIMWKVKNKIVNWYISKKTDTLSFTPHVRSNPKNIVIPIVNSNVIREYCNKLNKMCSRVKRNDAEKDLQKKIACPNDDKLLENIIGANDYYCCEV